MNIIIAIANLQLFPETKNKKQEKCIFTLKIFAKPQQITKKSGLRLEFFWK